MLIGYMRVSSAGDRQSTDLQLDALLAAGVDQRHIYTDRMSGARADRPELNRMLATGLMAGDTLVVWRLDRLGRSLAHLIAILDSLERQEVLFRSLTENIDTSSAMGMLITHIFAALAEYERSLTQERIMAGLAAAKTRGRRGGRPRAISQERLQGIRANLADGLSIPSVARLFDVNETTLRRALNR